MEHLRSRSSSISLSLDIEGLLGKCNWKFHATSEYQKKKKALQERLQNLKGNFKMVTSKSNFQQVN